LDTANEPEQFPFNPPTQLTRREFLVMLAGAVSLAALPLSACKGSNGETNLPLGSPTVSPPAIISSGVLRVGVATDNIPFAGKAENEEGKSVIIGLDVDIAAALADQLGLRLNLVDTLGRDITSMFVNSEIDLFFGYQQEDQSHSPYVLIGPYLNDGPAIFTMGLSLPQNGFNLDSLNGQMIAVRAGSLSAHVLETRYGSDSIVAFPTLAEAFDAVESGLISYVASDAVVGAYQSRKYRDFICLGFLEEQPQSVFLCVKPGNQEMTEASNQALREIRNNGTLKVIVNKWLGPSTANLVLGAAGSNSAGQNPGDFGEDIPDPSNSDSLVE